MSFVHAVTEIARKEVLQHLRSVRFYIIVGLMALVLLLLTLAFGPEIVGNFESEETSREHIVLLFYFSSFFLGGFFFVQLFAIVQTADAVCSEWNNRTLFLLLSKPVSRAAFVTGKFVGAMAVVSGTIFVLFTLDYLLLQPALRGSPTGAEVRGFFAAIGVLILGAGAFSALALFFSTLTRSTAVSILATLAMWILVFPLLGNLGLFMALGDDDFEGDLDDPQIDWSRYLSPGSAMTVAAKFLVPEDDDREFLDFFNQGPASTRLALLALLGHTTLYFGGALWVVSRRNFE